MRALRRAAVGLTLALAVGRPLPASAQAPPAGRDDLLVSGAGTAIGWWGAPGRPGFLPDTDLGWGQPWTLAGLVRGAWNLEEASAAPAPIPYPGTPGAQRPLLWSDSLAVNAGEGGGWLGYDAALARASLAPGLGVGRRTRPRGDLVITNGVVHDNGLSIEHGDSLSALRVEAASGVRDPSGSLAGAGRDLYDITGSLARGRHSLEGSFDHRRANAGLVGGEHQEVRGESGHASYLYRTERWRFESTFSRGYDRRSSGGGAWGEQSRLSDASTAIVAIVRGDSTSSFGVRVLWRQSKVAPAGADSARVRARELWTALRHERPFGDGRLEAELGIGHQTAMGRSELAPSLVYRFADRPWQGRVMLERLLVPVWADLAPGQPAFLQDTWATGLELAGRSAGGARARLTFLAGRSRGRAVITRLPLESLALRSGFRADPESYDFGLLHGVAEWRGRRWGIGVEGYGMARDASPAQAMVDPGRGGRAFVEANVALFQGDLVVRPRIEIAAVGPRESEAVPSRPLPGYATWTGRLQLTLADAVLLIEGRNLEGQIRQETWVDSSTGLEAPGPGRELRFTFSWRLWD